VAAAFQQDPDTMLGVREVVIMGGAFRETGNTSPVAEFNIFADPEAAQVVCESGMRLRWTPLDVTQRCLLRPAHLDGLPETPRREFARAIASFYMDYHFRGYGEHACFLHDPVAVAAVIWPELFRSEPKRVDVEPFGALTRGMTVADFRRTANRTTVAPNSQVTLGVDHERLLERLVPRLA
jgi:purine nucleosidase